VPARKLAAILAGAPHGFDVIGKQSALDYLYYRKCLARSTSWVIWVAA